MNKIDKFLKKLALAERLEIQRILELIIAQKWATLDIKKLKGTSNVYRVRKGKIRITYATNLSKDTHVMSIGRRNESTYNFL